MSAPALHLDRAPPAPMDRVFDAWARESFVWLPERGMGRLTVTDAPYDAAYFAKYERYAATPMGRAITETRRDLVDSYTAGEVVDVGIGCGDFVDARPYTFGYDVNPVALRWLMERGLYRDPYAGAVDAVTLWDAVEHIPEPARLLANVRSLVFACLPIVPGDGPPSPNWKHYRPDEHCWYWTRAGLLGWMGEHGFRCVAESDVETKLGRSDIGTFVFRRVR